MFSTFRGGCGSRHVDPEQREGFRFGPGPWGWGGYFMGRPGDEGFGGGPFGVRRPLRFLAHKLELDEKQFAELARILDGLKTERAQAAVDDRRSLSDFAEAMSGEAFDAGKVKAGADRRVASSERVEAALTRTLEQIHALLSPEQRGRFAYLIRTGVLAL